MPPKKDENQAGGDTIDGFLPRETKLLAAAFVASTGADKYDYDLMAALTGNTSGSLKKMFPPVKRKAIEAHPSFAAYLGTSANGTEAKAAPKAAGKKRKTLSEPEEEAKKELDPVVAKNESTGKKKAAAKKRKATPENQDADANKEADAEAGKNDKETGKKKAPAKARGRSKKGKADDAAANVKEATPEDTANGDGIVKNGEVDEEV